ncbi:beta strand repeat-containing protein [Paenibacillus sp. 2TAB23]|uniref:beta strand repeat-containing protein n=1 Tax=Paenibacillus sp. 2TAB23 TaxID=3233004 RepID=UPI003F960EE1
MTINMASPVPDAGNGVAIVGSVVTISNPSVDYIVTGTTIVNKLVIDGALSVALHSLSITASTANSPISVNTGNVSMSLLGSNRLESTGGNATLGKAGLEILQNASLILEEDPNTPGGSLTAIGGYGSSGIGSSINTFGGNLTIQSGHISANGYTTATTTRFSGAGIGAGASTVFSGASFGIIMFNGGVVNAIGGSVGSNGGAGIGAGHANVGSSIVTAIIINGGNITANGGDFTTNNSGAGIGSACAGANALSRVGSITISGDDTVVNAKGGSVTGLSGNSGGSGIGSSWPTTASGESSVGDITINGGLINASGGTVSSFTGSGIGAAGVRFTAISQVGDININGGTIVATGGNSSTSVDTNGGSGIGSGFASGGGTSKTGNITINGGNITANASPTRQGGAGIGAGSAQGTNSTTIVGEIRIVDGNVNAYGSEFGAGIGTGGILRLAVSNVTARTGDILIAGGNITAIGIKNSPGIGPGTASANALCIVPNIRISGGTITAKGSTDTFNTPGGAGIGTGFAVGGTSQVGTIEITNGAVIVEASSGFSGAGIGTGGATFAAGKGVSLVEQVIIRDSIIRKASSGGNPVNDSGVGIGAAYALNSGVSRVHTILIENSTLDEVYGSLNSSAIGSGRADFDQSQSSVGSITITGSTFGQVIGGNFGSGIGSGNGMEGKCRLDNRYVSRRGHRERLEKLGTW